MKHMRFFGAALGAALVLLGQGCPAATPPPASETIVPAPAAPVREIEIGVDAEGGMTITPSASVGR